LLVKVSFHPRWLAEGADGPYLVSPGLMLVVPRENNVHLRYAARAWPDYLGWGLGAGTLAAGLAWAWRRRRRHVEPASGGIEEREDTVGSHWVRAAPLALVGLLAATRLLPGPSPPVDGERLYEQASRAYGEGRWAAAAEYARHAVAFFPATEPRRAELLCVRGEALLRSGHPREARDAFTEVVERAPGDPHLAQALFSGAAAKEAIGDADGAALWRRQLREEFPGNPWTERLGRDQYR
jgi:TolA-binding protein